MNSQSAYRCQQVTPFQDTPGDEFMGRADADGAPIGPVAGREDAAAGAEKSIGRAA